MAERAINIDNHDLLALGRRARAGATRLARASGAARAAAIDAMADAIERQTKVILAANRKDMTQASEYPPAFRDRLALDEARLAGVAAGLRHIAALPDPVGRVLATWKRPNGLEISRVATPLGVLGIVFESRPNVAADAAGLAVKSGNGVILRPGSASAGSVAALVDALCEGMAQSGLDASALQRIPASYGRAAVGELFAGLGGTIDAIIPRGGAELNRRAMAEAQVPVFGHADGICHIYVDSEADIAMAQKIIVNAKMRRPGICGAAECLLVDASGGEKLLSPLVQALLGAGCVVRGDEATQAVDERVEAATGEDWGKEYLAPIMAVKQVDGLEGALAHIAHYGSGHTEAIITQNKERAEMFFARSDSAILLHNASTQYADGGEFGMGGEIGIATGKFHARGPVGPEQLTSFHYIVRGQGQCRP